jgi:RNA polymerase sigma-70 factor (ECF subfamily)
MGASGVANPATRADRADERSDEQLLEAYLNGDNPAFQRLVERYQRELYHFLVRFLGDRAAAEDVFQETFLQVHQSGGQFDLARRFRPWLFTIAANKARDLMRSQARRPTSPLQAEISPGEGDTGGQFIDLMAADIPAPSDAMSREELEAAVHDTVMGMPEHLREILLLSYFNQFPYKQIADILDIPLGTVKSRLHAAVASFGERWRERVRDWEDSAGGGGGGRRDGEGERSEGRPAPSSLRRGPGGGAGTSGNSPRTETRGENRRDSNDRRFGT